MAEANSEISSEKQQTLTEFQVSWDLFNFPWFYTANLIATTLLNVNFLIHDHGLVDGLKKWSS